MKKSTIRIYPTLLLLSMRDIQGFLLKSRATTGEGPSFVRPLGVPPLPPSRFSPATTGFRDHTPFTQSITTTTTTTTLMAVTSSATRGIFDPLIEAELCTDLAHVALDVTGLVGSCQSRWWWCPNDDDDGHLS